MSHEIEALHTEYQKEFDETYQWCREPHIITQEDHDNWPISNHHGMPNLGHVSSQYKQNISIPQEGFDLLKNGYGKLQFILNKQTHLYNYECWSLDNIQTEISQIEDFIKKATDITISNQDLQVVANYNIQSSQIEFLRLKRGYYENHLMTWEQLTPSSTTACVYGRFFLFYEFLLSERKKHYSEPNKPQLSGYSPLEQLDIVLNWFASNSDAQPHCNIFTMQKSLVKNVNYDIPFSVLYGILKKLEKDEYIHSWAAETTRVQLRKDPVTIPETRYQATWDGQYFISKQIGGYADQYKDKKRREEEISTLQSSQMKLQEAQTNSMLTQTAIQDKMKSLTMILVFVGIAAFVVPLIALWWDFWKFYHPEYKENIFYYDQFVGITSSALLALVITFLLSLFLYKNIQEWRKL